LTSILVIIVIVIMVVVITTATTIIVIIIIITTRPRTWRDFGRPMIGASDGPTGNTATAPVSSEG
jgi:hypothetical protein